MNLERVVFGQKYFDMAIVFKDFKKDVLKINAIDTSYLEGIKKWLDAIDIKYYESKANLMWRPILKRITDDPQGFIDDGGWEFLNLERSDSEPDRQTKDMSHQMQRMSLSRRMTILRASQRTKKKKKRTTEEEKCKRRLSVRFLEKIIDLSMFRLQLFFL